VILKF